MDAGIITHAYTVITKGEFDLQKEAGWLVSNAAVCATPEQVQAMVASHLLLESLATVLTLPETALLKMALSSLETVLSIGATLGDPNPYAQKLESLHIDETLDKLQNHKVTKIYEAAYNIARDFFEEEDEEGDMGDEMDGAEGSAAPQNAPAALNFGPPPSNGTTPTFSFNTQSFQQPGGAPFFQM